VSRFRLQSAPDIVDKLRKMLVYLADMEEPAIPRGSADVEGAHADRRLTFRIDTLRNEGD
jgi:hypothetical protein